MLCSRRSAAPLAVVAAVLVVIAFSLGACGGESSLVGKWTTADFSETVEFTGDGLMLINSAVDGNLELTYEIKDGQLLLGMAGIDATVPVPYTLDGDKLTLNDPDDPGPTAYTRVK